MKEFPGVVAYIKCGQTRKRILNDEQRAWLAKYFPVTENSRLAKAMGISLCKLHCFAREMSLTKSARGLAAIRKRRDRKAAQTNEKNGCYARKRGHPVSDATIEGIHRRFARERAGLIENAQKRMKRENPDKYKTWMEKRSIQRKECIRKEKMRVMYGLERKTNLKVVVMCPYKRSQIHHRVNAMRRGYVLTEDCSEGNPDRYIIYYDKDTKRSERFEENCRKDGFSIKEWVY